MTIAGVSKGKKPKNDEMQEEEWNGMIHQQSTLWLFGSQ